MMKLTQSIVAKLACKADRAEQFVTDDEQPGLLLRLYASGVKTYYADTPGGRVKLNSASKITLLQARRAAAIVQGEVAAGKDPRGDRKAAALAQKRAADEDKLTVGALLDRYKKLNGARLRPSTLREMSRTVRRVFAKLLDVPAARLSRKAVIAVLDDLLEAGSPVMADRAGAYLGTIYSWAVKRGMLDENPTIKLPRNRAATRDRVLTDAEIRAVWEAAGKLNGFGAIVRLLLLTGTRREEAGGMEWRELAPDLSTWTIPRERAKNHCACVLPLSKLAREIVAAQPKVGDNPHVFTGREDGASIAGFAAPKARLDEASGVTGWRLHDLRRTFATNMQRLGVRLEVTEALLNHVSGSRAGITGVYQRHDWADEKRAAMDAWGKRLLAIVEGRDETDNVVRLRKES
jgi:integrase